MTTELAQHQQADPATLALFNTNGAEQLQNAHKLVRAMSGLCSGERHISNIQGKKYPKVEWWTTMGGCIGVFAREHWVKPVRIGGVEGWEAEVGLYRGDRLVGQATSVCMSNESRWGKAEVYAIRSMAVTRATGKAFRLTFSFLAALAGLEATPAEEMPYDHDRAAPQQQRQAPQQGTQAVAAKVQKFGPNRAAALMKTLAEANIGLEELVPMLRDKKGSVPDAVPDWPYGWREDIRDIIDELKERHAVREEAEDVEVYTVDPEDDPYANNNV